jgi:hypothetical protein
MQRKKKTSASPVNLGFSNFLFISYFRLHQMAPHSYENYIFTLPSAFNSSQRPDPQNPASEALISTFNSADGCSVLRKSRQRANTIPWSQEPISLDSNPGSSSSTLPDFRHGLHTPRTPSNAFAQAMRVDFRDADINNEMDSGGDWNMEGYLTRLNNVLIAVLNKCILLLFKSSRTSDQSVVDHGAQFRTPVALPFSPYFQDSVPPSYYPPPAQQKYNCPALLPSPMYSRSRTMPEFSPPSLSPLNLTISLPQSGSTTPAAHHFPIEYPQIAEVPARRRKPKDLASNHALKTLRQLQDVKITASKLLTYVIEGKDGFQDFQSAFFSPANRDSLLELLDKISTHEKGSPIFEAWVSPRALNIVCEKIHKETEAAKPDLKMSTKEMTPEFIENWDINALMDPIAEKITPTLTAILVAATESKESVLKPKGPKSRNRKTVSI